MPPFDIVIADVLEWTAHYDGPLFHALLCDPPYHFTSIAKRFGKPGSAPAQHGSDGAFARASAGFMGQTWDGGDIAFRPETWAAFMPLLHPGAFGMAFASARGWHRLAVAIEDAGYVIHPSIFGWLHGQGFPKATRIDTQIDRAGANGMTAPATDLAKTWEHHRYGLQALKPALEPIIVFQKPYEGRPVDDITRTGAGALNVDGGRLAVGERDAASVMARENKSPQTKAVKTGTSFQGTGKFFTPELGRWPPNFALAHTPECRDISGDGVAGLWECAAGCPVLTLNQQAGERSSGEAVGGLSRHASLDLGGYGDGFGEDAGETYGDTGPASRFYPSFDWSDEVAEGIFNADVAHFEPKADVEERERGLRFVVPCAMAGKPNIIHRGDPLETETHFVQRGDVVTEVRCRRNLHPTIKPISLVYWLARLLLLPDAYAPRRLFVPFAGTGSEMIAAKRAEWEEVIGVELHEKYAELARIRLAAYIGML